MSTIAMWLSKAWLVLALAAGGVASTLPASASAFGPSSTGTPPAPAFDRLQRAWVREQNAYNRLGELFNNADQRITEAQKLIDQAKANGKDVSAVQAALDALSAAIKQAGPTFEAGKAIITAHAGFDSDGKVTDPVKAFETVYDAHTKISDVRQLIVPPAKALHDAVKAFRQANQPTPTPTP